LRHISLQERELCRQKANIQDARLSLASALLKRLFVAKIARIPWSQIRFARKGDPIHGKPCYVPPSDSASPPLDFNVSHQAGIVALVGSCSANVDVGLDVVCVNERDDYRTIKDEDFDGFVDMHEDFFSQEELEDMKYNVDTVKPLNGTILTAADLGRHVRCCRSDINLGITLKTGEKTMLNSSHIVDAKLRRFYTYWCYKEAYIKLDGEALLAEWLQDLEFKNVRSPEQAAISSCDAWGEIVNDVKILKYKKELENNAVQIQAFEEHFMLATAGRSRDGCKIIFPPFQQLNLEKDLMPWTIK